MITLKLLGMLVLAAAVATGAHKVQVRKDAVPAQAMQYKARLIREAHAAGGLQAPVAMFAAQIHQESRWQPTAKSYVGAMGLAQFMPGTAEWIANLYPADLKPGVPYDADWAIRAMVRYDYYLYRKLPKFDEGQERWAAALASYNGGLGWTLKDAKLAGCCDSSKWFCCVENTSDGRSAANWKENRGYPRRIWLTLKPLYEQAGWN